MKTVTSKDGTTIAFDKVGQGPALIMVVGAFNDRTTAVPLTQMLQGHYTVYNYDRRGRGDSSDTLPYAVEREIEDLDALITEAGGSAYVFGYSSGAVLSLKAVARGSKITKLALYDAPLMVNAPSTEHKSSARMSNAAGQAIEVNDNRQPLQQNLAEELDQLVKAGRRGDAVELFQTRVVGIPAEVVAQMRSAPFRPMLEKMAHTLVYEVTIIGDMSAPHELTASVKIPTLLMAGGAGPSFMRDTAQTLAAALPDGLCRILEGQTHDINPAVIAPVMEEFLGQGIGVK